jgi:beta-galactosidase
MRRRSFNDGWMVRTKVSPFAELAGESAEWRSVTLPHDAMIGTERSPTASAGNGYFVSGAWEYRRTLPVAAEDAGATIVLEFEGVYRDAIVSVNGAVATTRPYGYSHFSVQVDHLLQVGAENEIRVDARAHEDTRWYSGAGIYRNVWLLRAGRVHLVPDGLEVRTPEIDDDGAVVTVAAVVRNQSTTTSVATLRTEVLDTGGEVVARNDAPVTTFPGNTITARLRLFVANPQRWGTAHPNLYMCRVTLLDADETLDEDSTTFGIRSLALDPARGLRINGEPVLLRGACVHHDNGPLGAATIDRAEERRVELLKAAGFNAIRSAHNPMSRAMLTACDRLGMLVMDETFDMWEQSKSDDDYAARFADWWEADVEAMVRKDVNHACVIFYSIGNEIPDGSTPQGLLVGRALAEKVRSLDDTRFVTQAVSGIMVGGAEAFGEVRETAAEIKIDEETGINTAITNLGDLMAQATLAEVVTEKTVEAFSHLDAAGYNYMEPRFEIDGELSPHRVIVATETHAPSIDTGWAGVTRNAHVIGDFTWTGWDYLGEVGVGRVEYGDTASELGMGAFLGKYPWLTAWCGDLDIAGHRRPQSYYREIVFGLRSDPYLAVRRPEHHGRVVTHSTPWSWTDVVSTWTWEGHEGSPIAVEVYANADEVELLFNGRSLGRQPTGATRRFRAELETDYEPGEIVAVAFTDGRETGRMALRSASGPVVLDVRADRTEVTADPSDLAFVDITLVDGNGNLYNTADREVTVQLDGPGVLQGLGSANPRTEESFFDNEHTTFDGRALAVVRPTGGGTITVTVTADGCDSQCVGIHARD